jgi:hypothetical protein
MDPIQGKLIWKSPKPYNLTGVPDPGKTRLELTDLVRFNGAWYCAFHEGPVHDSHPSGRAHIIVSSEGTTWEAAALMKWEGADIWDPRLSVTAEGNLMFHAAVYFVSRDPRPDGHFYQLDRADIPPNDRETDVALQSVTWLSSDGRRWDGPYACASGVNSLRWDVAWHNGMGYSVGYYGKNRGGILCRTRDGKNWRALRENFFPDGQGNEAALAFGADDTAYCLLRCGPNPAMLGAGKPPYYQEWTWTDLRVQVPPGEYCGYEQGGLLPSKDFFRADFGGPKLIRLADGRLLAAGRVRGPQRPGGPWRTDPGAPPGVEDGRVMLFLVAPDEATLVKIADIDGTSYAGVAEHGGRLWVTYVVWWDPEPGVYLAGMGVPA